jgi:hypothetical protein
MAVPKVGHSYFGFLFEFLSLTNYEKLYFCGVSE